MKKITSLIPVLVFILSTPTFFANNLNFLEVNGQVLSGVKAMDNAVITVMSKDNSVKIISTDEYGYFKVSLKYNKEYTFSVIKEGHLTKTILFSTKAPDQYKNQSFKFYCQVDLEKARRNKKVKQSENKVTAQVFFDQNKAFFTHQSQFKNEEHWGYFYE